jgi:ribonuclease P protein component
MLPKNRRIKRSEFQHILSHGKRYYSPHLILYIANKTKPLPSQFSFSVSKKVKNKATDRNTYRRQGYAVIQKTISRIKPGYFFTFSFKKSGEKLTFSILEKEIVSLLEASGMVL